MCKGQVTQPTLARHNCLYGFGAFVVFLLQSHKLDDVLQPLNAVANSMKGVVLAHDR